MKATRVTCTEVTVFAGASPAVSRTFASGASTSPVTAETVRKAATKLGHPGCRPVT